MVACWQCVRATWAPLHSGLVRWQNTSGTNEKRNWPAVVPTPGRMAVPMAAPKAPAYAKTMPRYTFCIVSANKPVGQPGWRVSCCGGHFCLFSWTSVVQSERRTWSLLWFGLTIANLGSAEALVAAHATYNTSVVRQQIRSYLLRCALAPGNGQSRKHQPLKNVQCTVRTGPAPART